MLYDAIKIVIDTYAEKYPVLKGVQDQIALAESTSNTRYVADLFYYVEELKLESCPLLVLMHKIDETVPEEANDGYKWAMVDAAIQNTIWDMELVLKNVQNRISSKIEEKR